MSNSNFENEIDLQKLVSRFTNYIKDFIYNTIHFILKKKFILISLFIVGILLGFLFNSLVTKKESNIIVIANNNSVEYLYSKINHLQSNIFDKNSKKILPHIKSISVEPVIDVYKFIGNKEKNLDILKLYAEDGDINKMQEDKNFLKNYDTHIITINNDKTNINQSDVNQLITFLNNDRFYNEILKVSNENLKNNIEHNNLLIKQIDQLINNYNSENKKGNQLVYNNENLQFNDLLKTKIDLLNENNNIKIKLIENKYTINLISTDLNLTKTPPVNFMIITPFLLLGVYLVLNLLISFYKNYNTRF